jgi:hypothetical protein
MATLGAATIRNNQAPTTYNVNDLIYALEQVTLATSGSPNTYAQGYSDGLSKAVLVLQTVRDANYTPTPPIGPTY